MYRASQNKDPTNVWLKWGHRKMHVYDPPKCYHKALALQKHTTSRKRDLELLASLPACWTINFQLCPLLQWLRTACATSWKPGALATNWPKRANPGLNKTVADEGRGIRTPKNIEIQIIFQLRNICRKNIEQWLMIESHRNNDLHTHNNHRRTFLERIPPCLHFWNVKC